MSDERARFLIDQAMRTGATRLDLSRLELTGIPERLRELPGLVELDLSFNRITELPAFIGVFRDLRSLNLQSNELTDLPRELGELKSLVRLQIHSNRLTALPEPIGRLTRLERLVLGGNRIKELPEFLFGLTALSFLDVFGNELAELPAGIARLKCLTDLDLGSNRLAALPDLIGECTGLTRLSASGNLLREIPRTLGALQRLTHLDLSHNLIQRLRATLFDLEHLTRLDLYDNLLKEIPADVRRFHRLAHLDLSDNHLVRLPDSLGQLKNLVALNLHGNRLTDIPPSLSHATALLALNLEGNDLPPEIQAASAQGIESVMAYLREREIDTVAVREAKLVVLGEGEVGKSSLLAAMRGEPFVEKRPLTHGLEVKPLRLTDSAGRSLTLNAWDFGGQSTNRPFHHLFFTSPAIYVIAWNPRRGAAQGAVEYWVNLVRQRVGGDARLLIVATHADAHDHLGDLDTARLERDSGVRIEGFHRIDSRTGRGVAGLRSALTETASRLPHVERRLPTRWRTLLDRLNAEGRTHLEIADYLSRASAHGLDDASARSLALVATELGHWCHFPDVAGLENLVVLKGDWLSRAVSLALNDPQTRDRNGLVSHDRLTHLWNDPGRPEDERYPAHLHPALIRLMHRFHIAYSVNDARSGPSSLITRLVPTSEPDLRDWERYGTALPEQSYVIEFRDANDRPVIPEGLMFRLISWFHRFALRRGDSGPGVHWAAGMVLDNGNHGRALMRIEDERLKVTVKAAYPTYLCKLIADDVCNYLSAWKGLSRTTLIPCGSVCSAPDPAATGSMWFELERLQSFKAEGHAGAACSRCNRMVSLDALIGELGAITASRPQSDGEIEAGIQTQLDRIQALLESFESDVDSFQYGVQEQGSATRSHVSAAMNRVVTEVTTRLEEQFEQGFRLLADEGMEGPRLFTVERIGSGPRVRGLVQHRIRVVLYCEHSKRPVHRLCDDPGKGVYTLDIDRDWLVRARPWINLTARLLRLGADFVPAGAKEGLEATVWQGIENEAALAALGAKELASSATELADGTGTDPAFEATGFDHRTRRQIHLLHTMLKQQDPDFAGLVRVLDRDRVRWVHEQFAGLYVK
ncbi:hypothetical protein GCM10009853_011410 [Glycomyces scopariae]